MHIWGDTDFDWEGLSDAGRIIEEHCAKARIGVHWKEKYGTLRVTPFFFSNVHSLLYPGYVYIQYKYNWMGYVDTYILGPLLRKMAGKFILRKQHECYNEAYQKAIAMYPYLEEEILVDCDYPSLVKGANKIMGNYWKTYEK